MEIDIMKVGVGEEAVGDQIKQKCRTGMADSKYLVANVKKKIKKIYINMYSWKI